MPDDGGFIHGKVADFFNGCFSRFLNCTNGTKLHKTPQLVKLCFLCTNLSLALIFKANSKKLEP